MNSHPRDGLAESTMDEIAAMPHDELVQLAWKLQDNYDRVIRRTEDVIEDPADAVAWARLKAEVGFDG